MPLQSSKIEFAKHLIIKTFSFLYAEGYVYNLKYPNDETVIGTIDIEYTNEQIKRGISISYSHRKLDGDVIYGFNLSIVRSPYKDVTEDYFSMFIYLASLGKDFETRMVNHFDEIEAEKIVLQIAEALKTYAWDIVKGEKWLEGFYARWN